jgi:hypothetical protein
MLQRAFLADLDRERLKSTRNATADANPDAKDGSVRIGGALILGCPAACTAADCDSRAM